MRFEVLGPLRVTEGESTLRLGEPQQRKLLALLLASPNRAVATDHLIDQMWGDPAPPTATHLIQVYVSQLRRSLPDGDGARIIRDGDGYLLRVLPDELDVERLRTAVTEAEGLIGRQPDLAAALVAAALPPDGHRPLGDFADESPDLREEARRIDELRLRAGELQVEAGLRMGRHNEVLAEVEALTERHPYREHLWELRMLALYRAGRQAEALAVGQALRTVLAEDLGLDPSPAICDLEERILVKDPALLWEPPPAPCNLPEPVTSFVGRRWELGDIVKAVDSHRLVTLTGPGGIGKTRLAIEAARALLPRFPDGVWWVDLAPLAGTDQVAGAVASLLGAVASPTSAIEAVVGSLAPRTALVVFDNCEHLARPVGRLAGAILEGAPSVTVLATSRVPLGIRGEVTWSVPGLSLPDRGDGPPVELLGSDAVRLLVERGMDADRTFALSQANAAAAVEVCDRLDALPLAIEMAAARLRSLSPTEIAAGLDDRFSLLGGTAGEDRRHGSLEAACDWSYRLLEPRMRRVFDRLSVLHGSFDLEAAGAVGQVGIERLTAADAATRLVETSMITVERRDDRVRYRMLETLREYGVGHLADRGEFDTINDAHSRHFLGLAVEAGNHVVTPEFAVWSDRLFDAHDDLQQALGWSLSHHDRSETLRAAPALFYHWYRVGDGVEAARWSAHMLDGAVDAPPELRAWTHMAATFAANLLGDPEGAAHHSGKALRLIDENGSVTPRVMALYCRAHWAFQVGEFESMEHLCRDALRVCDAHGRTWDRAGPLSLLGIAVLFGRGDLDEARRLVEAALPLHRRLGHTAGLTTINPLSPILRMQGDLAGAERAALQACAWAEGTGWEAQPLVFLAEAHLDRGDLDEARRVLRRAVRKAREAGLDIWFRIGLRVLARVEARAGDPRTAAGLFGASCPNLPAHGVDPVLDAEVERITRSALGDDAASGLEADGALMTVDEALALAEGRTVVGV